MSTYKVEQDNKPEEPINPAIELTVREQLTIVTEKSRQIAERLEGKSSITGFKAERTG